MHFYVFVLHLRIEWKDFVTTLVMVVRGVTKFILFKLRLFIFVSSSRRSVFSKSKYKYHAYGLSQWLRKFHRLAIWFIYVNCKAIAVWNRCLAPDRRAIQSVLIYSLPPTLHLPSLYVSSFIRLHLPSFHIKFNRIGFIGNLHRFSHKWFGSHWTGDIQGIQHQCIQHKSYFLIGSVLAKPTLMAMMIFFARAFEDAETHAFGTFQVPFSHITQNLLCNRCNNHYNVNYSMHWNACRSKVKLLSECNSYMHFGFRYVWFLNEYVCILEKWIIWKKSCALVKWKGIDCEWTSSTLQITCMCVGVCTTWKCITMCFK